MSAVAELGTRPLRVFGPILLVVGVLVLVAAGVLAVKGATSSGSTVLVEGPAGQALTLPQREGSGGLKVLAATVTGVSPSAKDTCELSPSGSSSQVSNAFGGDGTTYQGREYRTFKKIGNGWQPGARLSCSGPALERVLVARDARSQSLRPAALLGFAGLGAILLGALGSRRRR